METINNKNNALWSNFNMFFNICENFKIYFFIPLRIKIDILEKSLFHKDILLCFLWKKFKLQKKIEFLKLLLVKSYQKLKITKKQYIYYSNSMCVLIYVKI